MRLKQHSFCAIVSIALLLFISVGSETTIADEFQVSLVGGSVITVEIEKETIDWTRVLANGDMSREEVSLSDVKQLVLSSSPASEQVADIRRLLNSLESQDYLERQSAEVKLSNPDVGGNFRTMIKTQADHSSYEVRYRVRRILDSLDTDDVTPSESEFDILTLNDGTVIEGDVGDIEIPSQFRGRKKVFKRADIRMIGIPKQANEIVAPDAEVKVEMFHQYTNNFYLPAQTIVDFDTAPSGAEIKRNSNVNDMFTDRGLKLSTEQKGYIGISGYGFKFANKPVATGNSICVFETLGTYAKRFKGTMEIKFCMPNQASVSAGVNEIGLLMARVNHSRDFIVEAYNADGQILASVESSDEPCVFAGIKSSEPIAKIRILSNPYLFRIDRSIDEDFAVDSICFSSPVPVTVSKGDLPMVRLKNGDLIKGEAIEIKDASTVSIDLSNRESIDIQLDEVDSINFANAGKPSSNEKMWMAMLPDRSTIHVEPGELFTSKSFAPLTFKPNELLAIWSARNGARFPSASDFQEGKTVLVFPTCRIVSDSVEFSNKGFSWGKDAKKLLQPVKIEGDEREEEDPTPQFTKAEYGDAWPESIPTVWTNPPKTRPAKTGRLQLANQQQLTLGPNALFQFVKIDDKSVTVSTGNQEFKISLKELSSIEFPKN